MTDFPRYSTGRGRFNITLLIVVVASVIGILLGLYGVAWLLVWILKIYGT